MSDPKKIVILYSGGLDSYIMAHMAQRKHPEAEVVAVYYDHGQPVAQAEMALLPGFVQVRRVDWMNEANGPIAQPGRREGAIMIPGRNMAMAVLAACQELPDEIWLGALHGETHAKGTDKNFTFLEKMSELVNYVLGPFVHHNNIKFRFPLAEDKLDKLGAVEYALSTGLTPAELTATRSCHDPRYHACGNCIQCVKRWAVFGACGFGEEYNEHPLLSEFGRKFVREMLACALGQDDYYGPTTYREMLPGLLKAGIETPELFEPDTLALLDQVRSEGLVHG